MKLKKLNLVDFRNYSQAEFKFSPELNLIIGPNASGKTNLLEAIYLLASGESFRALRNDQMISWEKKLALIEAEIDQEKLKISLTKEDGRAKKQFWLNGLKKTRRQFLKCFLAVIFRPEEIKIITGSPKGRREFLDQAITLLDWEYQRAISAYEKAIKTRNRVLFEIRENRAKEQELYFWDQTLAKNGEIIRQKREEFFNFLNQFFQEFKKGRFDHLSCHYQASPATLSLLKKNLKQDLKKGLTGIGPHRDDFIVLSGKFETQDQNLAFWGSRGQRRLAVLLLKLGQLSFLEEKTGQKPVLLLDDIFSELDQQGEKLVFSLLEKHQTILTSTEKPSLAKKTQVFYL